MNVRPDISLVICTYNRGNVLKDALESFARMEAGSSCSSELIIVDNCSTDHTPEIATRFLETYRSGDYVREERPGLSIARNTGFARARSDIIAFVDDDVLFRPGWLDAVWNVFKNHPEAVAMGGQTEPVFDTDSENDWGRSAYEGIYGSTRSGAHPKQMLFPEHPYGVNMAFRRSALVDLGGFDARLGRSGDVLLSLEETHLFLHLHRAGKVCRYEPEAKLLHRIPKERSTIDWALERHYWQGISEVTLERLLSPKTPMRAVIDVVGALCDISKSTLLSKGPRALYWWLRSARFRTDWRMRQAYFRGRAVQRFRLALEAVIKNFA